MFHLSPYLSASLCFHYVCNEIEFFTNSCTFPRVKGLQSAFCDATQECMRLPTTVDITREIDMRIRTYMQMRFT